MKMKRVKKNGRMTVRCAEGDRLWTAFLKVGKEWGSVPDRMRKMLRQKGIFEPDPIQLTDIKNRLQTTHKSFSAHIGKHGCWLTKVSVLKRRKKNEE